MKTNLIHFYGRLHEFAGSLVVLLLIIGFSMSSNAQLSGVKTINSGLPTGGNNYASFGAAVQALTTSGVNGPVVFQVAAGTYIEQVDITSISGTSAVNTVIFDGGDGNAATRTLQFSASSTTNAHTLRFNGCNNVTVQNLTIKADASTAGIGVHFYSASTTHSITLRKCSVLVAVTSSTGVKAVAATNSNVSSTGGGASGAAGPVYNIFIDSNYIAGGYIGVFLSSNSNTSIPHNFSVRWNKLENINFNGLGASTSNGYLYLNNHIKMSTGVSGSYGMRHANGNTSGVQSYKVIGNIIENAGQFGIGFSSNNANTNALYPAIIANNYIMPTFTNASAVGISATQPRNHRIYNNTILMNVAGATGINVQSTSTNANLTIYNNIISLQAANSTGVCINSANATNVDSCDYNVFMKNSTTSLDIVTLRGITYNTANFVGGGGFNSGSSMDNPQLTSLTNPTPTNTASTQKGISTPWVTTDIFGLTRPSPPQIGCAEPAPPAIVNDVAGTAIVFPADTICSGNKAVSFRLKNLGPNPLTTVSVGWNVNGVAQSVYSWSGNLSVNDSSLVNIGNINFLTGTSYNITIYTFNPNGGNDPNKSNDTIKKTGIYVIPTPFASPTSLQYSFCQGDSVQLSGTFSGSPPWNMTVMEGSTPNTFTNLLNPLFAMYVSPSATTTYTVASVSDSTGCVNTTPVPILVTVNPLPAANTGGPQSICNGNSTTLGAASVTGNTYIWSPATGLNNATVSNPVASPTVTTTYTLVETRTVTGCTDSNTLVVAVNPVPVVDAGSNQVLTTGSTTTLAGSASGGLGPYLYNWAPGSLLVNANVQNPLTQMLNFSTLFTLTVTDSLSGCSDTDNVMITISGGTLQSTSSASPTGICSGAASQLNVIAAGGTGNYSYAWSSDPPGFASPSIPNPVVNPTVTTKYYVLITDSTLSHSDSITVIVFNNPVALITPAGSTSLCQSLSLQMNATTGTGYLYKWFRDNVELTGVIGASHTTTVSGSFVLEVTNANQCVTTSNPVIVTVNPNPGATVSAGGSTSICQGDSIKLSANQGSQFSYQWRLNANAISGAVDSIHYATQSGQYSVIVTNHYSCSTTSANQSVTVNPIPNSLITPVGSTTICAGSTVTLNGNTGAGQTYKWYHNSVLLSGATASSYAAGLTGSYTLMVTNSANCSLLSQPVVVSQHPTPTSAITAGGPVGFCQGDSVLLTATTNIGTSWQWRRDGVNITGATGNTLWAKTSGVYSAVAANAFCNTASNGITVTVTPLPLSAIYPAGSTNLCPGTNVGLNASSGTGYTHQWFKDGIIIPGATTSLYLATQAGSYTVVVTSGGACMSTSTPVVVTLHPAPSAVISPAGPITFCQGDSAVLSASTGTGYSYLWRRDGIVIPGAISAAVTAKLTGSYTVTVINTPGCTAVSSPVVVASSPLPPAAITPQGPTTFCQGLSVQLNANFDSTFSYQWFRDGAAISGATQVNFTAQNGGSYRVQVSNSSACISLSAQVIVSLKPQPMVNLGPDKSLAASHSLTLDAGAGHATYLWSTGVTTQTLLIDGSQYTYGPHTFGVTVSNTQTCTNSDSVVITIIDDTGLEGFNGKSPLVVYPNPNKGDFVIRANNMKDNELLVEIRDLTGRLVFVESYRITGYNWEQPISVSAPTGIYMITLSSGEYRSSRKLIIN